MIITFSNYNLHNSQIQNVYLFSLKIFMVHTNIQNALPLVHWPPHGIAIDHSSIGVKEVDNTASVHWSLTVCCVEIFTSQHVTSVYSNLKQFRLIE